MANPSDVAIQTIASTNKRAWQRPLALALLLSTYILVCCISFRMGFPHYRDSYIVYEQERLYFAIAAIAAFSLIVPLFSFARFSFGYFVGFYLFSMVVGYLWLNSYSKFHYDHATAAVSAIISGVAFLLPALLITSPFARQREISERAFERLLLLIVAFCFIVAATAAMYNFRLADISDIYKYRDQVQFPTFLNYAIGATTSVLVPFAFACFISRKRIWMTLLISLISVSLYPSTLSKIPIFVPAWLAFLTLLSKIFRARTAVILSLLLPMLLGEIMVVLLGEPMRRYFNLVNWRMIMIPSQAMDIYNDYFAHHPLTHFCQIWLLKPFVRCALEHPISVEMQDNYGLGYFNASLFATEGIASVGPWLAPLSAFACGLIIALGNRVSAGLPARFVLISSAVLPQIITNVPLSTTILTHGLWILFLLWYITPRALFTHAPSQPATFAN